MTNARLYESQAGAKIAMRNNNLRYADDTTLMAESVEPVADLTFLGSKITVDCD